ncbi:acyl-CoA dehydrogenase family protein [Acetobacter thailandicus]|uniref:acyl-CoA dehydrogenase family protein n=1 Tax=Acetobacter thailandicus TaxID=1502842 RepID=UPI001BAC25D5|nr:acyl-CoA dehydrogenase family protein [Acetobacter thailandicus]MBS0986455.1 acyl-CoA/acyl-ACP dehydrogenase [Acetobacter thailandicus]
MSVVKQIDQDPDDTVMLHRVKEIARGLLASHVVDIDQKGYYPLDVMRLLGEVGALSAHLARDGRRLGTAIRAMATISRTCGATGFLMWCHMVCGLYLEHANDPALHRDMLDEHSKGLSFGGTALSNPMKALAGIERMALEATPTAGGYTISGALPWVSHIARGQYCGAMANVADTKNEQILFLLRIDDRVNLKPCPHFSGMEGTSTWSVRLDHYFVPTSDIIADPAEPLLSEIKAPFILLQTGMAAGIIQGCIDSMLEVEPLLGHVNKYLEDRPHIIQAELDDIVQRVIALADKVGNFSKSDFLDVLDVRTQGAELSLRAAQSALLHQGARGYLSSAAPQRRVREAQFVAIVTPAIKHLRYEMARLMQEELPS